jgi:hypothetical protein
MFAIGQEDIEAPSDEGIKKAERSPLRWVNAAVFRRAFIESFGKSR